MSNTFEVTFTDGQIIRITAGLFYVNGSGGGVTFQEVTPAEDDFSYPQNRNIAWYPTDRVASIREVAEVAI